MKILKTHNPADWSLKLTCNKCDSELEVEAKDVGHEWMNGDMREPGYDSYAIQCPVCEEVIDLSKDKLPKVVQLQAQGQALRHLDR